MYNCYTVELLNRDKIATRQAEADAHRRGIEGRMHGAHTGAVQGRIQRVAALGASCVTAARRSVAQAGAGLQHLRGPRSAEGQNRA